MESPQPPKIIFQTPAIALNTCSGPLETKNKKPPTTNNITICPYLPLAHFTIPTTNTTKPIPVPTSLLIQSPTPPSDGRSAPKTKK